MTTTYVSDGRTSLDECDTATGWTGSATVQSLTSPTPVEASGQLGMAVGTSTDDAYVSITSDDYSGGGSLSVWIQANGTMDTQAAGGVMVQVGDGTNRIGYHVGGSDKSAFRHESGPVKWECYLLDLAAKPTNSTAFAGSEANLNEAAITQVGVGYKTLSKALGGAANCFWDIIRFQDNGQAVAFVGGTTSGAAGNGSEAAIIDRGITDAPGTALGVIRELAAGVYGIQGNITIGNTASSSDQYWSESNITYAWEDRGLSANNYYRFAIVGSSTATNCEASFTACTLAVPSAASASFDGNGADLTVCTITGSTFIGFDQGIETSDDTGDDWTGNAYIDNGQVVANGCDLTGSTFSGYTGAANTSILQYNLNVDPDGTLDNCTFAKTSGTAHHAIEFGTAIADAASFTLRGCAFGTDFSATEGGTTGDETFHFLDTTGTITLNLVGCSGNFGYRTAGVAVTIVEDPVTLSITVTDTADPPVAIASARVFIETSSGAGPLPYQDAVTITQTAGTATVAHTAHGLVTGNYVVIRGATQNGYNKVASITVTTANAYEYAVDSGTVSPATGSPVSSAVIISGLSNGSGVITDTRTYSSNQPFKGWARKSSGSPYYQNGSISGTINSSTGFTASIALLSDE